MSKGVCQRRETSAQCTDVHDASEQVHARLIALYTLHNTTFQRTTPHNTTFHSTQS